MTRTIMVLCIMALAACNKPCDCDPCEDANEDTADSAADTPVDTTTDTPADTAPDTGADTTPDIFPDEHLDTSEDPAEDTAADTAEVPSDPGADSPELPAGCVLPAIPDTGLFIYYCMLEDTTSTMRFYREVELAAGGTVPYGEYTSCRVTTPARDALCEFAGADGWGAGSLVKFAIQTPSANGGWSCPETNGTPLVKYNGDWVALNPPITSPACRHNFDLP